MEQSPSNETAVSQLAPPSDTLGTIVKGPTSAQLCLMTSSTTMVQAPPPAVLSFRDQTISPTKSSTGSTRDTNLEPPPKTEGPVATKSEPFTIMEDLEELTCPERVQKPMCDIPMSPECALKSDWLTIGSTEVPAETDLDAFLSPRRLKSFDVPMSPEQPPLCADVPMSPVQLPHDDIMMSPDRELGADVTMKAVSPAQTSRPPLVSNPWDEELISGLLSALTPPLTSHPRYITWSCSVPVINPKTTISMGMTVLFVII